MPLLSPFFRWEKIPLKIIWSQDKNSIAVFLGSLCRVFMIQVVQGKLQFNLLEKTFQLAWSHRPGVCWWQSQCWKGGKNQMAQIPYMNPNSTQFPTNPCKLHPIKFPFTPPYINVSFLHFFFYILMRVGVRGIKQNMPNKKSVIT